MPRNNPAFDFICGKGFKIDVKSSTVRNIKGQPTWRFNIERNTVPDFFLCLAFDNIDDLNPKHIWLFPGKDVNSKARTSSQVNRIDKWNLYEQPLDKVLECCETLKS